MLLSDLPDDILGLISCLLNGFDNCSLWMASDSKLKQRLVNNINTDFDIKYTIPGRYVWPGNFLKKLQKLSRLSVVVDQDLYHLPIENVEIFPIETLKYFKLDSQCSYKILTRLIHSNDARATGHRTSSLYEYINLNDIYPQLEHLEIIYNHSFQLPRFSIDFFRFLPQKLKTLSMPHIYLRSKPNHDVNNQIELLPSTLTSLNMGFSTQEKYLPFLDFSKLPPNLTSLTTNARISIDSYCMIPKNLKLLHLGSGKYDLQQLAKFLPTGLSSLSLESSTIIGESIAHLYHLEFLELYFDTQDEISDMIKYPPNLKKCYGYFDGSQELKFSSFAYGLVDLYLDIPSVIDRSFFVMLPETIKSLSIYSSKSCLEFFTLLPKNLELLETDLPIKESLSLLPKSLLTLKFLLERPCEIQEDDLFPPKLETLGLSGVNVNSQTTLKTLPSNLKSFRFDTSSRITRDDMIFSSTLAIVDDDIISCLPRGLTYLHLKQTFRITDASAGKYPPNLQHLYLSGNDQMTDISVSQLPQSLTRLHLADNTKLTNSCIQHLPRNLLQLHLPYSKSITSKCCKDLPQYLSRLELAGSHGWTQDLPKFLQTLKF